VPSLNFVRRLKTAFVHPVSFWGFSGVWYFWVFLVKALRVALKWIAESFFVCFACVGVCMYQWGMTPGDLKANDIFSKKTSIWVAEHIVFLKNET